MLRENESKFIESLEISHRGTVNIKSKEENKQAVSKSDVKKILKNFERSPDIQRNTLDMYKQRADIDDNSKQVAKDFFNDLSQARKTKKKMHLCTAMSYRKTGIFKVAGRDVYEDLETGDFWKVSEDKKHVIRLFNEDEKGIADKRASKEEEQVIPNGTKCVFKLKHLTPKEFDNLSDEEFIKKLDNKKCTVDELATYSELGDKDTEYYDITFDNGTKLGAVSGFHLEPIGKKASKLNEYSVMGSHPGDGGIVQAESFLDAAALYFSQEGGDYTKEEVLEELKKKPGKQISDKEYQIGDYTVRLISKSASVENIDKNASGEKITGEYIGPGVTIDLSETMDSQGFKVSIKGTFRSGDDFQTTLKRIKDFWDELDIDNN